MLRAGDLLPNLSLPIPTKFLASPAKTLGGFGLVAPPFTNAYQSSDLGRSRPCEAFTNNYHREGGLGIDLAVGVVGVVGCMLCRVITVENGRHTQNGVGTMVVGVEKIFLF